MPKDQQRCRSRIGQHLGVIARTFTSYTSSRRLSESFLGCVVDLFSLSIQFFHVFDNAINSDIAFSSQP